MDATDTISPVLEIGGRKIGIDREPFVIAEAGVNHNGDLQLAHRLIDAASDAGADAVKFQTFRTDSVVSRAASTTEYQRTAGQGGDQRSMLQALELPITAWSELSQHAAKNGLIFLSTAFDYESLNLLVELGVDAVKVPSGEVDNVPLLQAHAAVGRPVLLSTGMATLAEVDRAVGILRSGAPGIAVLHCVSAYPAPVDSANLKVLPIMAARYGVVVGWSDHTIGCVTATIAAALGASAFERHLTLDRTMEGPDHRASAEPDELRLYIETVRETHRALGDGVKRPMDVELDNRVLVRRSYHARRALSAGDVLTVDDVELVRPATGVEPAVDIVGRRLVADVEAGSPVRQVDLDRELNRRE